jgi:hypothetical protein
MGAASAARRQPPLQVVRGQGRSAKPAPVPRSRQLATMDARDILCRVGVGNHSIDPNAYVVNAEPGGGWSITYTCAVCETEITKRRDRHGFRDGNSYSHRKGYLMEQGGRLTDREKADLFMRLAGKGSR